MKGVKDRLSEPIEKSMLEFASYDSEAAEKTGYSNYSYWGSTFRAFLKNRVAMSLLIVLGVLLVFTIIQPYLPGQFKSNLVINHPVTGIQMMNIQPGLTNVVETAEEGTLLMVVSQSGETADSLAALRYGKAQGMLSLAIVNVVGSSIAREADRVFYTAAGPEIAVATTKAYSAQLAACYMLAMHFGLVRKVMAEEDYLRHITALSRLPEQIEQILQQEARMQWLAGKYANTRDAFFIGRGLDYASVLEGALKLKEISYIHAEAYAAGELKHGTISLIEKGSMVMSVATQQDLLEKEISNMVEVHARGATLLAVTYDGNYAMEDQADFTIYIPKTEDVFYPSLVVVPLQLLAYYVSLARGIDVDKPRNLAKSVTVE